MSHEDFEVAIEKRLHGALTPEEAEPLAQHLAGCEACRRFEALTQTTEATMSTMTTQLDQTLPWEAIRRRVMAARRSSLNRGVLYALLATALMVAVGADWNLGSHPRILVGGAL